MTRWRRHNDRPLRTPTAGRRDTRLGALVSSFIWGLNIDPFLVDWHDIPASARMRMARRANAAAVAAISVTNALIGVETFLLVQLAFNGGQLTVDTTVKAPNFPAIVFSVLIGIVLNVVFAVAVLRPQLRWFASGKAGDRDRRREVQRLPLLQVGGTMAAWVFAVLVYIFIADQLSWGTVAGVSVAFALAGMSSACLTYLFAERAVRPLAVVALHDNPTNHVTQSVRTRMMAVWAVSSAVPMAGLLILNAGRWTGMLPPIQGSVDWATVVLGIVGLVAGARVIVLVGRAITDPLQELRDAVERVDNGDLESRVAVYDSSELGILQHGFNEMVEGLGERERMRDLFARHVGDTVAEQALEQGEGLVGNIVDVGVLFVDIVGSTTLAARQNPQDTAELLNRFFTIVDDVVDRHAGFVNKFEGDAALVVFGAPVDLPNPAVAALAAARDLARQLGDDFPMDWGIGVSYGTTFAGNIGSKRRYEYTVVGDPVNECARLSDLAKTSSAGPIVASHAAVEIAEEEAEHWRSIGAKVVRGRIEPTELFVPTEVILPTGPPTVGQVLSTILRPARRTLGI